MLDSLEFKNITILVIDDNPTNLHLIVKYLEKHGFIPLVSRNGYTGFKRAKYARPDLILLDVMMPGINGFETCRRLKADAQTKDIPVIFMTALSSIEDKVKGFAVGAVDYVTKPLQQEEVMARIVTHLRIRLLTRRLKEQNQHLQQQAIELKEAREKAESANRAKSEFLSNMSHELRTPLNAILGFSQLMSRQSDTTPKQQENLRIINRSGEHLLTLINDVLEMSKIEAGKSTLNPTEFDLHHMLDSLIEILRLKAQSAGLSLILQCSPDVPRYIESDESKVRQVLINLLSNAIKFTKQGGVMVRVNARHKGGSRYTLQVEVEDSGMGIAADELPHVFTAFVQSESGRQSQQGTGLGLPISRKFVQLMGGEMTVSSVVGQGTVFAFDMQVNKVKPITVERSAPRRVIGLAAQQSAYRLLVVDDAAESRQLLVELLSEVGFEIREAANGEQAVQIWHRWQPDLIFMDMRMPVMDGYEATKRINNADKAQKTIIIALTASVFEEERAITLQAGCHGFMAKPFRESEIFEALSQHLQIEFIYEAERQVEQENADMIRIPLEKEPFTTKKIDINLSMAWLTKLEEAALIIDTDQIVALIEEIRDPNAALAEQLAEWANNFEYEQILVFIEQHR